MDPGLQPALSVLFPVLTVPAQISPKNSWSHLRNRLEVRLWGTAFFTKAAPVTRLRLSWQYAAPSLPNSGLSSSWQEPFFWSGYN